MLYKLLYCGVFQTDVLRCKEYVILSFSIVYYRQYYFVLPRAVHFLWLA
jgi:hypothetical protein